MEEGLYLYTNDCGILQVCGSVVLGTYFQCVVRFGVLGEKLRCTDVSTVTVNLKMSETLIL